MAWMQVPQMFSLGRVVAYKFWIPNEVLFSYSSKIHDVDQKRDMYLPDADAVKPGKVHGTMHGSTCREINLRGICFLPHFPAQNTAESSSKQ